MRPARAGVGVEAMTDRGSYQLFSADLLQCPVCNMRVLCGFGTVPLTEHFDIGYKGEVARYERGGRLFHSWLNIREKQRFLDRKSEPDGDGKLVGAPSMASEYWYSCAWCGDGLLEGEGVECDRCGKRACQDHAVDAPNGGFYCNGCAEKSSQAVANQETTNTVHKVA